MATPNVCITIMLQANTTHVPNISFLLVIESSIHGNLRHFSHGHQILFTNLVLIRSNYTLNLSSEKMRWIQLLNTKLFHRLYNIRKLKQNLCLLAENRTKLLVNICWIWPIIRFLWVNKLNYSISANTAAGNCRDSAEFLKNSTYILVQFISQATHNFARL